MNKNIFLLLSAFLIASCAVSNTLENNKYELHFNSNEWFPDKYKRNYSNPLNIEITVKEKSANTFLINMELLGMPIDPLSGMDPSALHFFSICVYNYVSAENGQPAWIFGRKKEENTKRTINIILMVGSYESLKTIKKDNSYEWLNEPTVYSKLTKNCKRILKNEYAR